MFAVVTSWSCTSEKHPPMPMLMSPGQAEGTPMCVDIARQLSSPERQLAMHESTMQRCTDNTFMLNRLRTLTHTPPGNSRHPDGPDWFVATTQQAQAPTAFSLQGAWCSTPCWSLLLQGMPWWQLPPGCNLWCGATHTREHVCCVGNNTRGGQGHTYCVVLHSSTM